MAKKRKKNKKVRPGNRSTLADRADPFELYQKSVQDGDWCLEFLDKIFRKEHGRRPRTLREDFCGTALLCANWVRPRGERRAVGVDLDGPTLDWGRRHNIAPLGEAAELVQLVEGDVREGPAGPFDVTVAFNFSYWTFHQRSEMLRYFRGVRRALAPGGVFVMDFHGGTDAQTQLEEERKVGRFTYVWEQGPYDPVNARSTSWIHFRFRDGSELREAFTYDWRIWTMPEIRDLLVEAGFDRVDAWCDGEDDKYRRVKTATNFESFIYYLAAWKLPRE